MFEYLNIFRSVSHPDSMQNTASTDESALQHSCHRGLQLELFITYRRPLPLFLPLSLGWREADFPLLFVKRCRFLSALRHCDACKACLPFRLDIA
jgi:hypothetical protein